MLARAWLVVFILGLAACVCPTAKPSASPEPFVEIPTQPAFPAFLPAPSIPGEFQPAACLFPLPEDIRQGKEVECGYLTVPEQREKTASTGRLIRLAVAIFHPPGGATQPDPVIYLSGGPGASILKLIRYQYDLLSAPVFATGRDLVVFDQRGVGLSQPALDCPDYDEWALDLLDGEVDGRQVNETDLKNLLLDALRVCREKLAKVADLSAYNSAASADDVHDLILAFDWEQVNLWGGSYGTRLALEVMRRHPEGLRSVVLDAVYPPDVDLYQSAPGNFNRALERLFTACAENPVCSQAYPNLRQVFFQIVHRLDARPETGEITNPFTGETYPAMMNGRTLLALTFQLLYDSKLRYLMPQQIYAASQGDFTAYEQLRSSLIALQSIISRGMMYSVQCHEEIPFSSLRGFQDEMKRYPELGGMYENGLSGSLFYQICAEWGAGQAEASANQAVYSDIPTLLMSGEFDPITPPEWGWRAAETLENSYVFEYPGIGHGASAVEGCSQEMMVAFIKSTGSALDSECINTMSK
jgi:pimeloyl-ACP methyl ester carboxylesterase